MAKERVEYLVTSLDSSYNQQTVKPHTMSDFFKIKMFGFSDSFRHAKPNAGERSKDIPLVLNIISNVQQEEPRNCCICMERLHDDLEKDGDSDEVKVSTTPKLPAALKPRNWLPLNPDTLFRWFKTAANPNGEKQKSRQFSKAINSSRQFTYHWLLNAPTLHLLHIQLAIIPSLPSQMLGVNFYTYTSFDHSLFHR
ncbi:hypothetical protein P8452_46741 [Trifolium repens]|nr:hypothetical protein P8452_46741 [Trifolium repens]